MDELKTDLRKILEHIDPALLNYQEWVNVGMALNYEGYSAQDWESWSSRDPRRYHRGECLKKWESFRGNPTPITGATIVSLAKLQGYRLETESFELDWNSEIGAKDELVVLDRNWIEETELTEPQVWKPEKELIRYLEALFDVSDNVGYVTRSYEKDGRFFPEKGVYDRTAGQLIKELAKCKGDIGRVLGDYNEEAGAWIRFNPLDGKGVKNENVTEYRYALVESDSMQPEKQLSIIKELELPAAALVYSGGKSIHAIVLIEAASYDEYRKRVDYLYKVCAKNGLVVDSQNRNPSRLSRMPGVVRGGRKQFLIATNTGKASWDEWKEWIESINDDLPDPEALSDFWDNMPELSPVLIDGILRQGHKMLLAGPSKAGKSFALIELCCSIAEGLPWFGFSCAQGRVMYVNLELDRASCLHRFKDVYNALGWKPNNISNIDIWNLRGSAIPMDKLAPKLIRRAKKKKYLAIIIDPIYKVITGDENSADQMAKFCNQFDMVCHDLGASVIYCHHHSKGTQGQKKSMDRASGSGVFSRDPDALLDLIQLETNEDILKHKANKVGLEICKMYLKKYSSGYEQHISEDDMFSMTKMWGHCQNFIKDSSVRFELQTRLNAENEKVKAMTAWRIEATLREFGKFKPLDLWFEYPVHRVETDDSLKDLDAEGEAPLWKKRKQAAVKKDPKAERMHSLETAYQALTINGEVSLKDLMDYTGKSRNTIKNYIEEHEKFEIENGKVIYKN